MIIKTMLCLLKGNETQDVTWTSMQPFSKGFKRNNPLESYVFANGIFGIMEDIHLIK